MLWNILIAGVKMDYYLSVPGFSWGISSGQALPSILFLASAYSASRWARNLTCGVGLFWFKGDPNEPLLAGRFKMRIWGGGAADRELSWITMVVFNGDLGGLWLESLKADKQETFLKRISNMTDRRRISKDGTAKLIIVQMTHPRSKHMTNQKHCFSFCAANYTLGTMWF